MWVKLNTNVITVVVEWNYLERAALGTHSMKVALTDRWLLHIMYRSHMTYTCHDYNTDTTGMWLFNIQ